MTTETIERTPAQERKDQAAEQVTRLQSEQLQLQTRKQEAGVDATRLDDEITKATRTGADQKTLAALRRDRADQERTTADLDRVLSVIEQELVPARAQLEDADKACKAEKYNAIVEQQRALAEVIEEAVHTIVESMKVKEGLAEKQKLGQGNVGCPQHGLSTDGMRVRLREILKPWLNGGQIDRSLPPFSHQDWSCRAMHPAGHLEA